MKRYIFGIMLLMAFVCVSCNKDVRKITGDYSYKLSGKVDFVDAEGHTDFIFMTERGQLNILENKKGSKGDIILTFNVLNGSNYSCNGRVKGDSIFINSHEFYTRFSSADTASHSIQIGKLYKVNASGRGFINNNIIVIDEKWNGQREDGENISMKSDKISILAEKN